MFNLWLSRRPQDIKKTGHMAGQKRGEYEKTIKI